MVGVCRCCSYSKQFFGANCACDQNTINQARLFFGYSSDQLNAGASLYILQMWLHLTTTLRQSAQLCGRLWMGVCDVSPLLQSVFVHPTSTNLAF